MTYIWLYELFSQNNVLMPQNGVGVVLGLVWGGLGQCKINILAS